MKRTLPLILALGLALPALLPSAAVTLSDGSVLKGEVTTLENGDLLVKTAAGEVTVPKDKVVSTLKDGASPAADGMTDYERKVYAKRAKHGNEDGIPRDQLVKNRQVGFFMGGNLFTGDALSSHPSRKSSDLSGFTIGGELINSMSDHFAWERWASFSMGQGSANRLDLGIGPRFQAPIGMGEGNFMVPFVGIGPAFSVVGTPEATGLGLGGAAVMGADLRFGKAVFTLKARYLLEADLKDHLGGRNLSAVLPSIGMGFAY